MSEIKVGEQVAVLVERAATEGIWGAFGKGDKDWLYTTAGDYVVLSGGVRRPQEGELLVLERVRQEFHFDVWRIVDE